VFCSQTLYANKYQNTVILAGMLDYTKKPHQNCFTPYCRLFRTRPCIV